MAALWSSEAGHDPFLLAHEAIVATQDVPVGTGIAVSYARTPMATATAAWHLQRRSNGRFILGLGTQVRPHVERRYGTRWPGSLAPMREYVEVLGQIWSHWQRQTGASYRGRYYQFTLSNPEFEPGPLPVSVAPIPIWLAAVGTSMARLCGEVADGVHVHSFHTADYLRSAFVPAIREGARLAGREVLPRTSSPVFAGVAHDEREAAELREHFAQHLGFYASTPSYRSVLEHGGWGGVHDTLRGLARAGRWSELGKHVPASMLAAFVTIADAKELGTTLARRYDGLVDQIGLYRGGDRFMGEHDWDVFVAAVSESTS
jgi:probable F420-dependent oxidoreductase